MTVILLELNGRLPQIKGLHVGFGEIDERIEEIYYFCTRRYPDKTRVELFRNLKIEPREIMPDINSYEIWLRN